MSADITASPNLACHFADLACHFAGFKQAALFQKLKDTQFSGQVVLTAAKGHTWIIYLYMGRIIYAFGEKHLIRAWLRNVSVHCPYIPDPRSTLQHTLTEATYEDVSVCWQYQVLCLWVTQQKITREQAASVVRGIVLESLFDIEQDEITTVKASQGKLFTKTITLVGIEAAIAQTQALLEEWRSTKLANTSPNLVPLIPKLKQLKSDHSQNTLLSGQYTLRDISINMKRDLPKVAQFLVPYIQSGIVELTEMPDFPAPVLPSKLASPPPPAPLPEASLMIACVDDSPLICQEMQKILTGNGYRFVGVNDPLRAIAALISRKPDLIFLDLVMPNTNGYEICSQLRKLAQFRNTPIVILTGQDGLVDRVRAKLVGASDFLSKPASEETVLSVIHKYVCRSK